jgi:flagellar basal-body rod protein FlgG
LTGSFINSKSGLSSSQNIIDAVSNNISNISTNGYKSIDTNFEDVLYQNMDRLGLPVTTADKGKLVEGNGSNNDALVRNSEEGVMIPTEKQNDLAIDGPGFIRLKGADGKYYYTRDCSFTIDANGNLVHSSGKLFDIANFKPQLIKGQVNIREDGTIFCNGKAAGKINLYDFKNRDGLLAGGDNLFTSQGEKPDTASGKLKQGYIENSNVNLEKSMTDLIIAARSFDINSKSLQSSDDMQQLANNLRK